MKKSSKLSLEKGDLLPTLLMLPGVLVVLSIMLIPLLYGLFISLFDYNIGNLNIANDFVGLDNYVKFLNDPTAVKAVKNTVLFSFGAVLGSLSIGTLLAVLIFRLRRQSSNILRPIITTPLLISPIIVGLIWRYIYDANGILYWFLGLFKITMDHFPGVTSPSTALLSTIIAYLWQSTPFVIIVITAGLVSIPQEYYEAAYVDGAGGFYTFWKITFPLLHNVYMIIILINGVDTIKVFDLIYGLTGGGPNDSTMTTSLYAFKQSFEYMNMGYGMALSVVAMVLSMICFGIPFIRNNMKSGSDR